jgi:hypothetical protein
MGCCTSCGVSCSFCLLPHSTHDFDIRDRATGVLFDGGWKCVKCDIVARSRLNYQPCDELIKTKVLGGE